MSFTPVPLTLPVRVKVEGAQLVFDKTSVLIKYLKTDELLVAGKAAQCGPKAPYSDVVGSRRVDGIVDADREQGRDKLEARWWTIQDVASLSGAPREGHIERRVAKLSFDGPAFTQALRDCADGPDLALYEAFLEGGTLELDVFVSEQSGQQATAPLILRLALNYV